MMSVFFRTRLAIAIMLCEFVTGCTLETQQTAGAQEGTGAGTIPFAEDIPDTTPEPPVKVEALEEYTNSLGMKFRLIPKGTFTMGSPPDEAGSTEDELQHQVTISQPFYLGVYEVTQSQFEKIMGYNHSFHQGERIAERHPETNRKIRDVNSSNLPVDSVRGVDAEEFCRRLSLLDKEVANGMVYRLPTEEEWEYACRAGGTTVFSNGNSKYWLSTYAWYSVNANSRTHQVGTKSPNGWGLYDMHGNVSEWCSMPPQTVSGNGGLGDAALTLTIHLPIVKPLRGGSITSSSTALRSANRSFSSGGTSTTGFRVACSKVPNQQLLEAAKIRKSPSRKNSIGMEFKSLPAGTFEMGSKFNRIEVTKATGPHTSISTGIDLSNAPIRTTTIEDPFEIGVFEVSQSQWHAVMDGGGVVDDDDSSIRVSWQSAIEFCRRLSAIQAEKEAGYRYRLPTEAEWEYACRAGTKSLFNFGDNPLAWQFNVDAANRWGIYRMHGNYPEWCAGLYSLYKKERVVRGIHPWAEEYDYYRKVDIAGVCTGVSAHREGVDPDEKFSFRVVRTLDKNAIEEAKRNQRYAEASLIITDVVKKNPVMKNSIGMSFKEIPPGIFLMGDIEPTLREISIDTGFEMSLHEVTQFDFERIMGINPSSRVEKGFFGTGMCPVDRVSYAEAIEFCNKLTSREEERRAGYSYRLPSEKEWEYVCRAGSQTTYFWGSESSLLTKHAWYWENSNGRLQTVGLKAPNSWGFFDMLGNAGELCSDRWVGSLEGLFSNERVSRGGRISSSKGEINSFARTGTSSDGERFCGFRVVRTKTD